MAHYRCNFPAPSRRFPSVLAALAVLAGAPIGNAAADPPVILQWFEVRWTDMERRIPDFFLAGYGGTWVPPAARASSTGSAGYDVFDRFDLGRPGAQTAYGTEAYFKAMIAETHQANGLVHLDAILNHNSGRQTGVSFQQQGGYPGFWMAPATPIVDKQPTHNWGDFHNSNTGAGYLQSENPGGARYDLYKGDLVGLIDIAQETNHQFIRHPVAEGNPQNIPVGTVYNKPEPSNFRCYPDRDLTGVPVTSPGTFRNPGVNNFTFYPYNTADPMQGDAVTDNGTGLLMRWTQWMMDEHKVDGFRYDAIKHVPSWFWDTFIDSVVYQRRVTPDGRKVTPYTFGEAVEGNQFIYDNFIRKPNNFNRAGDSFGNRDCLDINGSGQLRDLVNVGGLGTWQNALNAHLDNVDGGNDGTVGLNHVYSHDNGTTGDGGSAPADPTLRQQGFFANAYVLMRTGPSLVYHNARGISRPGGFWPKHGVPIALGVDPTSNTVNATVTRLVQLHNWYGRGEFNVINSTDPVNQSLADVIVFERRTNLGGGNYSANVLVGANDSYANGVQYRNVQTSFPAGTRLLEQTGNSADAAVDPTGIVADVLVVDINRRVLLPVPNNKNVNGVEHNKGFVVYGPAVPAGTLTLLNSSATLPADPAGVPKQRRRMAAVPVVRADEFQIKLTTSNGDAGAPNNDNADDNAVFRIDQGYRDFNGSGSWDLPYTHEVAPGYEEFVTTHQPLAGTGNTQGLYAQTIDATQLAEGFHYISVVAFRKRNVGEAALYRDFRQVVYIDRTGPDVDLVNPGQVIVAATYKFTARAADRTANKAFILLNLADGTDPIAYANANPGLQATANDRFEWVRTISALSHGYHRVTVVGFEEGGSGAFQDYTVFVDLCPADFNDDGFVDGIDSDGFNNAFEAGDPSADYNGDGFVDGIDSDSFNNDFEAGC